MTENIGSKTKITNLNTDCFVKICRYFDQNDLYNFNDAFGDAVDYVVKTSKFDFKVHNRHDFELFKRFVELYGREMKYLKFDCHVWKHLTSTNNLLDGNNLLKLKFNWQIFSAK